MSKTIAILNFKGGVGKTTTAINLGDALHHLGKKVLIVDLDSQCSATLILDTKKEVVETLYDTIRHKKPGDLVVYEHSDGLDFIAASKELGDIDELLVGRSSKEHILRRILSPLKKEYDYILFDCPPNRGILTINAMVCSDSVLIPIDSKYMSLDGLRHVTQRISEICEDDLLNPSLKIEGFLLTRFHQQLKVAKEVQSKLKETFGSLVLRTYIRENTKLSEAPGYRQTIFEYEPHCAGAEDYKSLAEEIEAHPA